MQRKQIQSGEIYAFLSGNENTEWRKPSDARPVLVTEKTFAFKRNGVPTGKSEVRLIARYLDRDTLKPFIKDEAGEQAAIQRGLGSYNRDREWTVEPRDLKRLWSEQVPLIEKQRATEARIAAEHDAQHAEDDAARAAVEALLNGPNGDLGIRWERRNKFSEVSSVTVTPQTLAKWLKAARTAALDEAFSGDAHLVTDEQWNERYSDGYTDGLREATELDEANQ